MKHLMYKFSLPFLLLVCCCCLSPALFSVTIRQPDYLSVSVGNETEKQQMIKEIEKYVSDFLIKHIVYPPEAKMKGIQGRVICSFYIDKEGRITEPVILRGLGEDINKEVLRVLQIVPDDKLTLKKELFKEESFLIVLPIHFNLMKPVTGK